MDIFQNSILSTLEAENVRGDAYIPGIECMYTQNDMRMWMEKISTGDRLMQQQSTHIQEQIYDTLRCYAAGSVASDKLVNIDKLEMLGFDAPFVNYLYQKTCTSHNKDKQKRDIYDHKNDIIFQNIFMSIFLNTHAVCRPHDLISALAMGIDAQKYRKNELSLHTLLDPENDPKIESLGIHDVVMNCQKNHMMNSSVQNVVASQVDDIKKRIEETIMCRIPFDETFLTVVSRAIIEPKYAVLKFEEAVSHFKDFSHNEDNKCKLLGLMISQNVNLESHLQLLKKELFLITLPFSWSLADTDNTIVMDILLNVMLGCNSTAIRTFAETIEFSFISNIYLSDTILSNIDLMMKHNSLDSIEGNEISDYMIRIWKRASAFIAFLGLFRLIFPNHSDITIERVDHFNSSEVYELDKHKRYLALNCIYFYKDNFYLTIQDSNKNHCEIKTKSFYELFYQIITYKTV
jgi:hypothetical protein